MLQLSSKGDYGLMFLKHLAQLPLGQFATVKQIAEAHTLPEKYLERVASALAEAGILLSRSGQGGGYALAKTPRELPLVAVLQVLEGELEPVKCTHDGRCCERASACGRKTGWQHVQTRLYQLLSNYSLADVLASVK